MRWNATARDIRVDNFRRRFLPKARIGHKMSDTPEGLPTRRMVEVQLVAHWRY